MFIHISSLQLKFHVPLPYNIERSLQWHVMTNELSIEATLLQDRWFESLLVAFISSLEEVTTLFYQNTRYQWMCVTIIIHNG